MPRRKLTKEEIKIIVARGWEARRLKIAQQRQKNKEATLAWKARREIRDAGEDAFYGFPTDYLTRKHNIEERLRALKNASQNKNKKTEPPTKK